MLSAKTISTAQVLLELLHSLCKVLVGSLFVGSFSSEIIEGTQIKFKILLTGKDSKCRALEPLAWRK